MLNTIAAIPTPVKYTENNLYFGYGIFIPETGVVWAPVNCGYEPTNYKYGKLYQWGRKYGCGYSGSDADTIQTAVSGQVSLEAEDPYIFYLYSGDWCSTTYYNLWDSSISSECTKSGHIPTKADRDPCPEGWRVPTYAELLALRGGHTSGGMQAGTHGSTSSLSGKWFDGSSSSEPTSGIFLPAAGRHWGSYNLADERETNGHYWCSSAHYNNQNARDLTFTSGSAEMDVVWRTYGYSVRCVQE